MDSSTLYTVAAAAALLYYVALLLRWRSSSAASGGSVPGATLPGPAGVPLLGSLPFLDPELHTHFAELAATHGPIFRLRLGSKLAVIITSSSIAREVLRDHDAVFANRDVPAAARAIAYGGNDIVWTPNNPTWRMLRRVTVHNILSPASLNSVYPLRRRHMRSAVKHIKTLNTTPFDVGNQLFLSTMNVVTGVLWGGSDFDVEEFRGLVGEITELLATPNLSDFFPGIEWMDLQGIRKKMGRMLGRFDKIFEGLIEKRRGSGGGGGEKDFLEHMLKMEQEGGDPKTPFTMVHVKSLLMDMVVGGTDTTSNTSEWAMAHMLAKPDIMRRVQAELDEVVGKDNVVEESHTPKLHYLATVIKEVLRLHPALPLMVPHCPSSPSTVGGYAIPQGSRVFVNVWAIHRDPSIWENPLEFNPDRFADGSRKYDFSGNDFSYFPFGSGRRICAGIAMAERMMSYSLATLMHSFDWRLSDGAEHDLTEKFGIVLKKAKPLVAIATPRLANPELYTDV